MGDIMENLVANEHGWIFIVLAGFLIVGALWGGGMLLQICIKKTTMSLVKVISWLGRDTLWLICGCLGLTIGAGSAGGGIGLVRDFSEKNPTSIFHELADNMNIKNMEKEKLDTLLQYSKSVERLTPVTYSYTSENREFSRSYFLCGSLIGLGIGLMISSGIFMIQKLG